MFLCQRHDTVLGDASVVQPLLADLCAGALAHGLLDKAALAVGEERVHPHKYVALGLGLELWLAVDGPAEQLLRVARGHDAARYHAAGERVSAADVLNRRENLGVIGIDGGAHPVGLLGVTAEHIGMAKRTVRRLRGNPTPHVPAASTLATVFCEPHVAFSTQPPSVM